MLLLYKRTNTYFFKKTYNHTFMKRFATLFFSLFLGFFVFVSQVEAATLTISGTLQTTDPASNSYGGNYMINTAGGVYYFNLQNSAYQSQVGKTVAFIVEGTYQDYVVLSSTSANGSGSTGSVTNNSQQLPTTGTSAGIFGALGVISSFLGYLFSRKTRLNLS